VTIIWQWAAVAAVGYIGLYHLEAVVFFFIAAALSYILRPAPDDRADARKATHR